MEIYYAGDLNIWWITVHIMKLFSNGTCALEGFELDDWIFMSKKTVKTDMILKICYVILSFKGQVMIWLTEENS